MDSPPPPWPSSLVAHTHAHVQAHIHTCTHACAHTHTYTCTRTGVYAHACAHTHTRAHLTGKHPISQGETLLSHSSCSNPTTLGTQQSGGWESKVKVWGGAEALLSLVCRRPPASRGRPSGHTHSWHLSVSQSLLMGTPARLAYGSRLITSVKTLSPSPVARRGPGGSGFNVWV